MYMLSVFWPRKRKLNLCNTNLCSIPQQCCSDLFLQISLLRIFSCLLVWRTWLDGRTWTYHRVILVCPAPPVMWARAECSKILAWQNHQQCWLEPFSLMFVLKDFPCVSHRSGAAVQSWNCGSVFFDAMAAVYPYDEGHCMNIKWNTVKTPWGACWLSQQGNRWEGKWQYRKWNCF